MQPAGWGVSLDPDGWLGKKGRRAAGSILPVLLIFAFLSIPASAQGTSSGSLLWTYVTGNSVAGTAITPDGSLVAAISDPAIRQAFMTVIQVDDQWAQ